MQLESTACVVCGSHYSTEEARSADYIYETSAYVFTFVKCTSCGHVYLNPRPAPSEVSTIYPETYPSFTSKFSTKSSLIRVIKSQVMKCRMKFFDARLKQGGRVLDVGCGDGLLLLDIKRRYPDVEAYGLDWHFSMPISERLAANRVQVYEKLVEEAVLPEMHFDLVIMNQLIEHLWEPQKALKSIWRSMKPGGLLTIETPNPDGYDRKLFPKGAWGAYYTPRHLNLFSKANLQRLLSDNGFHVMQHYSLCAPLTWTYSIQSTVKRSFPRAKLICTFFRDTNVFALMPFAFIDSVAKFFGVTTSNQKVIARRCE